MPAAPRTMSPNEWVTNGKLPSWASVNSAQPPCEGAKFMVCESRPTVPSTTVRSKTVPMTWNALHLLGPALSTYMRTRSPRLTAIGALLYWLAYPLNAITSGVSAVILAWSAPAPGLPR